MTKIPRISSALKSVDLEQNPPPLIIGERVNSQGSRKAKEMVLKDDFEGLLNLARSQVEEGAHCLDICVATTERSDELDFMCKLVKRLSLEIDAPLVIDSTDPKVVEAAIRQIPGRPVINSINLEGDGSRFHLLSPIMVKYGVPAIAMCIGPNGMAKTPKEKLETARLLFETGKKYGLQPWQYIFDVLTFTLATGQEEFLDSAKNTLEGIKLVKENLPGCFTTLGLSNVSFGLPPRARKIINSVFLYHAIKAGLDSVIINPKDIIAYTDISQQERKLAENLIFNLRNTALSELISYYENELNNANQALTSSSSSSSKAAKRSNGISTLDVDPNWNFDKKCYYRIVNRLREGIEQDVLGAILDNVKENNIKNKNTTTASSSSSSSSSNKKIVSSSSSSSSPPPPSAPPNRKIDSDLSFSEILSLLSKEELHNAAVKTLNETLLPAMKEVGDKFGAGEIILPFVLKSAECMKAAVAELEKYLIKQKDVSKGKIVLCTVYGDVHDIGKNLVKTILTNNGYSVYDLGKQVPLQTILNKISEVDANAVGLSALLVSTSKQMQIFVEYAREHNIQIPILCGGAAINSNYINRIAKDGGIYESGVFYCKTAFDGLNVMNKLMSNERNQFISKWRERVELWKEFKPSSMNVSQTSKHSGIKPVVSPPVPPTLKRQIRLGPENINLKEVWDFINKKSLFTLSWSFRGKAALGLAEESEKLLAEWKKRVIDDELFSPRVVYGYFPCHNKNNKLVVESPNGGEVIFDFPRSTKGRNLCLTDYFGENDIVAFQSVTVGSKVSHIIEKWNEDNRYTDAYYLHGLAVETAEALADWTNSLIRKELKIDPKRGLRYSWGYPSCPDITQHRLVWQLLDPSKSDMTLTEAGQIIPDHSTAAIFIHHPEAEYFTL
ncbi:MAG TPA: dihydropteroate synthase [Nitrososphaeraceae archaeon]|nr:dihydropteroate synthase [Nitrososphaeraceae archaeon]